MPIPGKQLSDFNPDGTGLGQTTLDTIGFFGVTPVAQPHTTNMAAATNTAAVSFAGTPWGFATSAQANAVILSLIEIRTALVNLGLIKGAF